MCCGVTAINNRMCMMKTVEHVCRCITGKIRMHLVSGDTMLVSSPNPHNNIVIVIVIVSVFYWASGSPGGVMRCSCSMPDCLLYVVNIMNARFTRFARVTLDV